MKDEQFGDPVQRCPGRFLRSLLLPAVVACAIGCSEDGGLRVDFPVLDDLTPNLFLDLNGTTSLLLDFSDSIDVSKLKLSGIVMESVNGEVKVPLTDAVPPTGNSPNVVIALQQSQAQELANAMAAAAMSGTVSKDGVYLRIDIADTAIVDVSGNSFPGLIGAPVDISPLSHSATPLCGVEGAPACPEPQCGVTGKPACPNPQCGVTGKPACPEPQCGVTGKPACPEPQCGVTGKPACPNPECGVPGKPACPDPECGVPGANQPAPTHSAGYQANQPAPTQSAGYQANQPAPTHRAG